MIEKIQKLISDLEAEKVKAFNNKCWYKQSADDITFFAMNESYEVAFTWCIGRLTQILKEQEPNKDIQPQLQQAHVIGCKELLLLMAKEDQKIVDTDARAMFSSRSDEAKRRIKNIEAVLKMIDERQAL